MVKLVQIKSGGREKDVQPLFSAYAEWLAVNIQRENGVTLDSAELLHSFMEGIDKFYEEFAFAYNEKIFSILENARRDK